MIRNGFHFSPEQTDRLTHAIDPQFVDGLQEALVSLDISGRLAPLSQILCSQFEQTGFRIVDMAWGYRDRFGSTPWDDHAKDYLRWIVDSLREIACQYQSSMNLSDSDDIRVHDRLVVGRFIGQCEELAKCFDNGFPIARSSKQLGFDDKILLEDAAYDAARNALDGFASLTAEIVERHRFASGSDPFGVWCRAIRDGLEASSAPTVLDAIVSKMVSLRPAIEPIGRIREIGVH